MRSTNSEHDKSQPFVWRQGKSDYISFRNGKKEDRVFTVGEVEEDIDIVDLFHLIGVVREH